MDREASDHPGDRSRPWLLRRGRRLGASRPEEIESGSLSCCWSRRPRRRAGAVDRGQAVRRRRPGSIGRGQGQVGGQVDRGGRRAQQERDAGQHRDHAGIPATTSCIWKWRHPGGHHVEAAGATAACSWRPPLQPRDQGYEVQILDSSKNPTYVDTAGCVYKQHPPLSQRQPAAGRVADLRHHPGGARCSARTARWPLRPPSRCCTTASWCRTARCWRARRSISASPATRPTGRADQAAGARRSQRPISFRNIWVRELAPRDQGATRPAAGPCSTARRGGGAG